MGSSHCMSLRVFIWFSYLSPEKMAVFSQIFSYVSSLKKMLVFCVCVWNLVRFLFFVTLLCNRPNIQHKYTNWWLALALIYTIHMYIWGFLYLWAIYTSCVLLCSMIGVLAVAHSWYIFYIQGEQKCCWYETSGCANYASRRLLIALTLK